MRYWNKLIENEKKKEKEKKENPITRKFWVLGFKILRHGMR